MLESHICTTKYNVFNIYLCVIYIFSYRYFFCFLIFANLLITEANVSSWTHAMETTTSQDFNFESSSSPHYRDNESSTQYDLSTADWMNNESETSVQHQILWPLISKSVYETFKSAVWLGLVPISCLIGIGGNGLGVWFVVHKKLNQPFMIYLLALMATDFIYLIMELFSSSVVIMERFDLPVAVYWNCYVARPFLLVKSITYGICVHLITTMSIERLLNIVCPFKIKFCSLQKYTVLNILGIVCWNIAVMVLSFFMQEPKVTTDNKGNILTCISGPTHWTNQNFSFVKHYTLVTLVVVRFAPVIVATISNLMISICLALYRKRRASLLANRTSGGGYPNQGKTTLILLVLSIFLILSLVPSAVGTLLMIFLPEQYIQGRSQYNTYALLVDIGLCLRVVSAANDFFIYVVLVKSSRTLVKQMLMAKCCFSQKRNVNNPEPANVYSVSGPATKSTSPDILSEHSQF